MPEGVPQLDLTWPVCSGCQKQIDPDVCGCGVSKENHNSWEAGHSFVPMGCDCLREKK